MQSRQLMCWLMVPRLRRCGRRHMLPALLLPAQQAASSKLRRLQQRPQPSISQTPNNSTSISPHRHLQLLRSIRLQRVGLQSGTTVLQQHLLPRPHPRLMLGLPCHQQTRQMDWQQRPARHQQQTAQQQQQQQQQQQ